jgi:hypothetical protein
MSRTVPFGTFTSRKDLNAKGGRTAKRTLGPLIGGVYEATPKKGGRRDWAHRPQHTPNTIVRIVPLHMYGQGQTD